MRSTVRGLATLGTAVMLVTSACGPATSAAPSPGSSTTAAGPTPTPLIITPAPLPQGPGPNGGTVVRWFIGLGAGTQPAQIGPEQAFAAAYNASQKDVYLSLEIVDNTQASNILKTELASGTAPDIIGPVGVEGLNLFQDQLLDLKDEISKNNYTSTGVDQKLVDFFNSLGQNGATVGLPFAVYPSFIFYNKDLFDEAGLPYPPTKVGDTYQGKPWDLAALRDLAMKLTVDKNGKDATEAGFDKSHIVQYGFEPQRDDLRGLGAYWGAGNLSGGADGKTVTIPDAWKAAWKFFYDGMWGPQPFIMTGQVYNSQEFNGGGYAFFSGRVAMSENFLWTTYGVADAGTDWDLAAIPAYNGQITSPLNADTFAILKSSKNPDAAFAVLTYMLGDASDELLQAYGGMPARPDKQDAFFDTLGQSAGFPKQVDWQVVKDSVQYADHPNFEAPMPKYNETLDILSKYLSKWTTTPGLNMDSEINALQQEIQTTWNS